MEFWKFENLITRKEYPTNQNLEIHQVAPSHKKSTP